MYRRILIDYEVLRLSVQENAMMSIRRSLLRNDSLSLEDVPKMARSLADAVGEGSEGSSQPRNRSSEPRGDAGSRVMGMAIGGGAGAFFLILLVTYAGVPRDLILGAPGIGLALGAGLFSFRRSKTWGALAALLGYAWTVCVLWLQNPAKAGFGDLALELPLSTWGALQVLLVAVVGALIGAGWEKTNSKPAENE